MSNERIIDGWSIAHLIFGIGFGYIFVSFLIPIIVIVGLIIFFELIEHLIIGNLLFRWSEAKIKENLNNSIADIIIGTFGLFIAFMIWV